MKKYLVAGHRGKYEIKDTFEEAKKICDRKNKHNVWKCCVRELTEGKYIYNPETGYLEYRLADAPVVYKTL